MRSKIIIDEIDEIKAKNRILNYVMTGIIHPNLIIVVLIPLVALRQRYRPLVAGRSCKIDL